MRCDPCRPSEHSWTAAPCRIPADNGLSDTRRTVSQRDAYRMGSIEKIAGSVIDDRPDLFCRSGIAGQSSKALRELLFQLQHLLGFLFGDCFDRRVGIRRSEACALEDLHDLLLKDDEAGGHLAGLHQLVQRGNAVIEVPPFQKDGQHGFESRSYCRHEGRKLRDVSRLVLHDLFAGLGLFHLIDSQRQAIRITSVSDGAKTISYEYDLLGQLTRVNDPHDTTAGSTGTTWQYTYDQGGNIQSKTAYAFTSDIVGSAVKTDIFTYGDANWKDKLTAFNGQTITYDAIGNPLNDGTWNYSWINGRRLRCMHKGELGEQGYDEITYDYNEDGLCTKKTRMYYDDATGDIGYKATSYTLHGKNIVHMTENGNELHFFYDVQNKPAVVVFNGTAYAYLYNLQGDVIGLVDSNGAKMVSYSYDAWGKMISKTGSLASTLGTIQPFRYRGYVFDEETGLYYLQTRYYVAQRNRFVNADTVLGCMGYPLTRNIFTYCVNAPVVRTDDTGMISVWDILVN